MATAPIPSGYHSLTPYLIVQDAAAAIDFYANVFGASEVMRMPMPNGKIGHAELRIGDSHLMLADAAPEMGHVSAQELGNTPVSLVFYVGDVDAVFAAALKAGASEMRPVTDQFWGDRMGTLRDPFGHVWSLATHVEDVAPDEMARRFKAACAGGS